MKRLAKQTQELMSMPIHPEFSAEELETNRRQVLRKLGAVAKRLEDLLAGQNVDLLSIPLLGKPDPAWNKIARTRYYMKMLDGVVKKLAAGDYGYCLCCQSPIRKLELQEMPWADTCSSCAAKC